MLTGVPVTAGTLFGYFYSMCMHFDSIPQWVMALTPYIPFEHLSINNTAPFICCILKSSTMKPLQKSTSLRRPDFL